MLRRQAPLHRPLATLVAFALIGVVTHTALADALVSSGNWNVGTNWSTGSVPVDPNGATIGGGLTATLDSAVPDVRVAFVGTTPPAPTAGHLNIEDGALLRLDEVRVGPSGTVTHEGGALRMPTASENGAFVIIDGNYTQTGGLIERVDEVPFTFTDLVVNSGGHYDISGGRLQLGPFLAGLDGVVEIKAGGLATISGDAIVRTGDVTIRGGIQPGAIVQNGGDFGLTQRMSVRQGATYTLNDGILGFDSQISIEDGGHLVQTGGTLTQLDNTEFGDFQLRTNGFYEISGGSHESGALTMFAQGHFKIIGDAATVEFRDQSINDGTIFIREGSILELDIDGGISTIVTDGSVSVSHPFDGPAILDVEFLTEPLNNQQFTIIANGSDNPVDGTFLGLPEGALFSVPTPSGMIDMHITYLANTDGGSIGNDVVLTAIVPEPTTFALLLLSALALLAPRRRR